MSLAQHSESTRAKQILSHKGRRHIPQVIEKVRCARWKDATFANRKQWSEETRRRKINSLASSQEEQQQTAASQA